MSGSQEQMRVQMVQLCRAQQASKDAIEKMKKVLADTNSTAKWMSQKEKDISRLRKQIQELERAANALTLDDMLEILDIGREHPLFDSRKILRSTPEVSQSELALSITTDDAFREWQAADTSAELFIETQLSSVSSRHVSAVSLVSSNLVQSLQDRPEATVIYFFCGHHTAMSDAMRGPSGMMRSLITQILRLCPVRLDFVSVRLRQQLELLNFRALCETFTRLVRQFPVTTVLSCIVDSISFFEGHDIVQDCKSAVEVLQDLVYNPELGALLLLLVTSPTRMFPSECRLSIMNDDLVGRNRATERRLSEAGIRARETNHSGVLPSMRSQNLLSTVEIDSDDDWHSDAP
ncbi:hypothetical protein LTR64_002661 [Lithohypha guttulata]|uniref:uncharacterized protein n=1 Tax=Lithohypha guttulata TaxID=1690604 RepID=UPI00315C9526